MELPDSSNLMKNFTMFDESGGSEDFDSHVDASDDLTHVQMESEDVTEVGTEQEEFMPNQESENSTETLEPAIHPYADLIQSFEYQQEQVEVFEVGTMKKLDETTFEIIGTQEALMMMIGELKNQREISLVPLFRKWKHLIVLTIGTMEKEYVIDGIKLGMSLVALKEIFINPKILKVVHRFDVLKALLHNIGFNTLIRQEYGCEGLYVNMSMVLNGLENPLVIINLRKQAHYLFYLYHDIKNYLLLNDEEGYMNLLEKMQKESMSLKIDKKELHLDAIRQRFIQEHKCQLDVLQELDDWRYATFGEDYARRELPKEHLTFIARQLPQTVNALRHFIKGKLSLTQINEILEIVKGSRREHFLPVQDEKEKDHAAITVLERAQQQPQQSNNIQENIQINPQNMYKRSRPPYIKGSHRYQRAHQHRRTLLPNPIQNGQVNLKRTLLPNPIQNGQVNLNRTLLPNPTQNGRVNLRRFKLDKSRTTWIKPKSNSTSNEMFSAGSSTSYPHDPQNKIQLIEDKSVKNSNVNPDILSEDK